MLTGQYETPLVWISILVAMLASYTALSLAGRVKQSEKTSARWWIGGGAFAMGTGIWAMHFIGMLAFRLPIAVGYDLGITFLSWLIPVVVSALALWQVSQMKLGLKNLTIGALLMGIGINAMHYVGMAAMRMQPGIDYDPWLVAASLAIAISAAAASLWIAFNLRHNRPHVWIARAGAAVVMGFAIVGMHYTGMAAADFPLGSICMAADSGVSLNGLAVTVIIATLAVLAIAMLTSVYDARLEARATILALAQDTAQERQVLLERERAARAEAESARADAERMSALKDQFLATLSHELRTPLNAILGWAQLLQVHIKDEATLQNALATIERNARAQAELIEDLLDVSRIVSGKVRLDMQMIDPTAILKAAVETVRPSALEKDIQLSQSLDRNAGSIQADPARLQQVMWNLLSNAIKFTPEGGTVQVSLTRVGNFIEIDITDTGIGLTPDFIPYMFDLFRQANASTTRGHGGLGIGLSIVKQLVDLHGGSISAASGGVGKGTTVRVSLPLPEQRPAHIGGNDDQNGQMAAIPGPALRGVDLSGVKVLVVDDEADARLLIKTILEECNARVTLAESADQALALLMEERPHVLVSDISMPDMDGFQLIQQIREFGEDVSDVPAIALTALARKQDQERALQAGFCRHLAKPVDAWGLVSMVAGIIESRPSDEP